MAKHHQLCVHDTNSIVWPTYHLPIMSTIVLVSPLANGLFIKLDVAEHLKVFKTGPCVLPSVVNKVLRGSCKVAKLRLPWVINVALNAHHARTCTSSYFNYMEWPAFADKYCFRGSLRGIGENGEEEALYCFAAGNREELRKAKIV
eukprot:889767-Amphidinium_carterae.1